MPLLGRQEQQLRDAGFTGFELGIFNENLRQAPQVFDLNKPFWQARIKKRKEWVAKWIRDGGTKVSFAKMLNSYYRSSKKASPWDFVKLEYKPPKKASSYKQAQKRRIQKRLSARRIKV